MGILSGDSRAVFQIANEFTVVRIAYVNTGSGERMVITSPRLGYETHLDSLQLESLTWQTPELYSSLLETPYGPGTKLDNAHPLSDLFVKRSTVWDS